MEEAATQSRPTLLRVYGLHRRGINRPVSGLEAIIRVLLLGVAAGGGLPQWNCACSQCQQARGGVIQPQTQSSIAVGDETGNWFLINASPDLPLQMRTYAELAPRAGSPRNSPVAAVFLTSADVDHVLGLLSLREGNALHIYATPAMQQAAAILGVAAVLQSFCGVVWHPPAGEGFAAMRGNDGRESSLRVRVLPLSGRAPRYAEPVTKSFQAEVRAARRGLNPQPGTAAPRGAGVSPAGFAGVPPGVSKKAALSPAL